MDELNRVSAFLKKTSKRQINSCIKRSNQIVLGIFATAWGFIFTTNGDFNKFLLSIVILLVVCYFICTLFRQYYFALYVRKLHELSLDKKCDEWKILEQFNKKSDWTVKLVGI